ncbi:hypothetical protein GBQ13_00145 [Mycobacterium avium subsp. hominissuis]|nr:hypothetical protein [Mycobacterium avium subsp. hominissuis]
MASALAAIVMSTACRRCRPGPMPNRSAAVTGVAIAAALFMTFSPLSPNVIRLHFPCRASAGGWSGARPLLRHDRL